MCAGRFYWGTRVFGGWTAGEFQCVGHMTQQNFDCSSLIICNKVKTYWRRGWDSSVGTATRYGLDGRGIEFRWG
jgi:hypothetical protein